MVDAGNAFPPQSAIHHPQSAIRLRTFIDRRYSAGANKNYTEIGRRGLYARVQNTNKELFRMYLNADIEPAPRCLNPNPRLSRWAIRRPTLSSPQRIAKRCGFRTTKEGRWCWCSSAAPGDPTARINWLNSSLLTRNSKNATPESHLLQRRRSMVSSAEKNTSRNTPIRSRFCSTKRER